MGIRVSPKHGVNPSLGICFWCGEEDGTVLLLGMLPNDAEAPRHAVGSLEPCDKCKAHRALGITFIEVDLRNESTPTGRWCVVKEEGVRRLLNPGTSLDHVLEKRAAYVDSTEFDHLMEMIAPKSDGDQNAQAT